MLTLEEIDQFLVHTLKIPDWKQKLETNRVEFVKEFFFAYSLRASKQNVPFCAVSKPDRKIPTPEEALLYGKRMIGTCIHLNYFIKVLLEKLGFDTFNVGGEVPIWRMPRCHMATIIRFPPRSTDTDEVMGSQGEIYMADAGFGRPLLELIPLHRLPHVFKTAGFGVEYRFNEEKQRFERIAHGGCPVRGKFKPKTPTNVEYAFDLTPVQFDDLWECYEDLFSPRAKSPFMDGLFCFRMTAVRGVHDYDYVACRNIVLIEGTQDTIKETVHENYDAMLPAIKKYFPDMNPNELTAAIANYTTARETKLAQANGVVRS